MNKRWKWIAIGAVGLVALWAAFANLDVRGVEFTCLTAAPLDTDGRRFGYTDPAGADRTWEFSAEDRLIGLNPGEPIGFGYRKGRLSGMLCDVRFYLLDAEQGGRVAEFSIQRAGTGSGRRAAPTTRALPLGCPH